MAEKSYWGWPPSGSPLVNGRDDRNWSHFDSSVNAISFGFVATAVLISMFLVLAILERFLRPTSPEMTSPIITSGHHFNRRRDHIEQVQIDFMKPSLPLTKVSTNAREVSVLMPGETIPRFIAQPTPPPCPPERFKWPTHHSNISVSKLGRSTDPNSNPNPTPNAFLGSIENDIQ
ncbi:uncharacterized protein LOC124912510 [Impatiens glandulifera]|uniref:uncharacterized protein LOC124912510 n=1 Tax=Impatiens glandulifera TaxID=253017 RepID=UPI001FB04C0C|nr:uncharacterized protein LOC124912510 [Impatiens glandulifera]